MAAARPVLRFLAWALAFGLGTSALADVLRFEWAPHAGAAYYEGTLASPAGPTRIRTTSHWLLLQDIEQVSIDAYSAGGARLESMHVERHATVNNVTPPAPVPTAEQAPEPAPAVAIEDPFATTDLSDAAYGDTETPESVLDEPVHELELPAEEAPHETPASPSTAGQATGPVRGPSAAYVSVTLGLGKEWLSAKGGVSEYKGDANIGGLTLRGEMRKVASPWFSAAQVSAHNFTTAVAREDESTGTTSEAESKFLRLTGRAVVFYDFNPPRQGGAASYTLGLGLGLDYYRLPMLVVEDESTGIAELALRSTLGVAVALQYARYLTDSHTLGAEVAVVPMTLSKDVKGMSTNVLMFWRHAFVPRLFTEFALLSTQESLTAETDCPVVAACADKSRSASRLLSLRVGIGSIF